MPFIKSLPHCKALPGSEVMKLMADWKPDCTTLPREESAEPMPETMLLKAFTATCFKLDAMDDTKFFSPFQADEAVFLIAVQILAIVFFSPLNRMETWFASPCASEPTTCLMPFQMVDAAFLILFQMFAASSFSFVKFPVTMSIRRSTGPSTTFLISSHAPEAAVLMPFQTPCSVVERFSHRERIMSTMPASTGLFIMFVQILLKKSPTDCHSPLHHAGMPWKNDTREFQAFGIVSVKNEQMTSHAETKNSLICVQMAFTASRNHPHLLYSATRIATTAAIARGTQPIAATTAEIAGITVPDTKAITPEIALAICGTTVMIVPIAPTTLPITISTGPRAAATRATVTMIFFVPSSRLFSQSTSP